MFTRAQSKDEYEEINEWINVEIQRQQNIQMNELETIIRTQFDEHVDNMSKVSGALKTTVEAIATTAAELEGGAPAVRIHSEYEVIQESHRRMLKDTNAAIGKTLNSLKSCDDALAGTRSIGAEYAI